MACRMRSMSCSAKLVDCRCVTNDFVAFSDMSIRPRCLQGDEVHSKRLKAHGVGMNEADELKLKIERSASEHSGDSSPRSLKTNSKPSEPSKLDYIHVRARRGQATDSHSLAERVSI